MTINIVGFSSTAKVPGFFGETVFGAGAISAGDIPLKLLLCGTKTSAGTAVADTDVVNIFSTTDADTYFGPGSELAIMCYGALQNPGVAIKAIASAEAGGAVAATATITLTGTWTSTGTAIYRIDGIRVTAAISSTDTISSAADSIVNAINAIPSLSVTAVKGAATAYVITITRKSKGLRGLQGMLFQDITQLPTGCTSTIAGGTSVTGGGVHFVSGTGTDSVTNVLAVLATAQYDRIAAAQNDGTNGALWVAACNTQAGPTIGHLEHLIFASNASLSTAQSIAQTSLNAERAQYLWQVNGETIPSYVAATFAARRTAVEQSDPGASYDGYVLPGVAPQSQQADWASYPTLVSALDNSLTPVTTNANGQSYVVRSITTKSLTSGAPDYRTLDTSQAVVPDYVRTVVRLFWETVFKVSNPKVFSDPADGERDRPAGVATPSRWNQSIKKILLDLQDQLIISDVANNAPVSEYNSTAKRIMSIIPVIPTPSNHSTGVSVRQAG
jgi:phage tail sheath gpL-like